MITEKDDRNYDMLDILKNCLKTKPHLLTQITQQISTKIKGDDEREDGPIRIANELHKSRTQR